MEEEIVAITCQDCQSTFAHTFHQGRGSQRKLCDDCIKRHEEENHANRMLPEKLCAVCFKPMWKRSSVAHTGRCLNLYNSGNHRIGMETQKDMQKVFSYDETSVLL